MPNQFNSNYRFNADEVGSVVSSGYKAFLRDAGYVDLDITPNLFVVSSMLRVDDRVAECAAKQNIGLYHKSDNVISRINQYDGRMLVNGLGGVLLTNAFMRSLVIPSIKDASKKGEKFADSTLNEMVNDYAEFTEDSIKERRRLVIGNAERDIELKKGSGYFNRSDIDEYGFPTTFRGDGKFMYWNNNNCDIAVIRNRSSGLNLSLSGTPADTMDVLGVRFAKFFRDEKELEYLFK